MAQWVPNTNIRPGRQVFRYLPGFATCCLLLLLAACFSSPNPTSPSTTHTAIPATPTATPLVQKTALLTYRGNMGGAIGMVWSPDGKRIASGGYNKTVQVWDAKSGHLYLTYRGHYSYVFAVAWSPDGTRIVSATGAAGPDHPVTSNNSVKVWDATTGKTLLTYAGDADQVEMYALAWSPDSKRIASGGDDKMVHIWDAATGHTSLLNQGHTDLVWAVAWSPDGKELASASQDGTVEVWHVV